jgi:hypothetical protein
MDRKEYLKKWRLNNKKNISIFNQSYYKTNKEKMNNKMKELRKINKEKYKIIEKEWRNKNKEKIKIDHKEWYNKNKVEYNKNRRLTNKGVYWNTYEHRKEYLKKWQTQKRQKDLLYRLNSNISRRIRKDLKRFNLTKKESTQKILPYSMQELKEHIEKQFTSEMNWNNMGEFWEIDHSTPIAWCQNEKDMLNLWALSNLRPLLKQENREKQDLFSGDISNTLSSIGR